MGSQVGNAPKTVHEFPVGQRGSPHLRQMWARSTIRIGVSGGSTSSSSSSSGEGGGDGGSSNDHGGC